MKHASWTSIISAAAPYYRFNEANRPYHNYSHALEVMDNVIFLHAENGKVPDNLLLAAIWHDAVYIPGACDGLNEQASAAALEYEWKRLEIDEPPELLNETKWLIERTSVTDHMITDETLMPMQLGILLDADLGSLALPYNFFVGNQANILSENLGDPYNAEHVKRQKNFLAKFLTVRKNIYHTALARKLWEPTARENIQRFISG